MRTRPIRALLHPVWLGALALLVVNDHLLKGAGWLPGWMTGKLSDVAGLVVAPVLLAALLGAGHRRAVAACFLAVGIVFAALQVVPGAAVVWDAALTSVGLPWQTVADPTDLLVMPVLVLAYLALVPAMEPRPLAPAQRGVAWLGAGAGLVACLATSPPRTQWTTEGGGGFRDIEAQVWLHNDSDVDRQVRIRQLRGDVVLDCAALDGADVGIMLGTDLFHPAVIWELPPFTTVSAIESGGRDCYAVLVEGETFEPQVLFWQDRAFSWVPGEMRQGPYPEGRVSLPTFEDDEGVAFPIRPRGDTCEPQSQLDRLDWSVPSRGLWTLLSSEVGVDGCLSLDLDRDGLEQRGYLCMPPEQFPFEDGDELTFDESSAAWLDVTRPDGAALTLMHLQGPVQVAGLDLQPVIASSTSGGCGWVADHCGHVARDAALSVDFGDGEGAVDLLAGDVEAVELIDERVEIAVSRSEYRGAYAGTCGAGPTTIGFDVDVVVSTHPNPSTK
ncbi:MAG: hypothetical protein KTR31_14515 [Myxococcales bacterium]|nr:hypothetical protein [Myxococcales bacterium]